MILLTMPHIVIPHMIYTHHESAPERVYELTGWEVVVLLSLPIVMMFVLDAISGFPFLSKLYNRKRKP